MADPTATIPADIATMSFEDALSELEKIVRQIEDGRGRRRVLFLHRVHN